MIPKNLGDQLQVLNLHPVAAVTGDGLSSAVDIGELSGEIAIILDVSAPVAGTTPGLACKLQHSDTSGGSYTDVTGGAFTAIADSAGVEKISLNKDEMKRWVKLNKDISGTDSPQYLVSSKIVGMKKYQD